MKYISKRSLKIKLIILTSSIVFLVALLCYVLFHYGAFTNFNSLFNSNYSFQNKKSNLINEKNALVFELNNSKKRYDSLIIENSFLKESILNERDSISLLLSKIESLELEVLELNQLKINFDQIKNELFTIKNKQNTIISIFNSDNKPSNSLKKMDSLKNKNLPLENSNETVIKTNRIKNDTQKNNTVNNIEIHNLNVSSYYTKKSKLYATKTASKVDAINIEFEIKNYTFTNPTKFYIQFFDSSYTLEPTNNVFLSGKKLNYNYSIEVEPSKDEEIHISKTFLIDSNLLSKNTYFINVFDYKGNLVSFKSIDLF